MRKTLNVVRSLTCDKRYTFRIVWIVIRIKWRIEFAFIAVTIREIEAYVHLRIERLQCPRTLFGGHYYGFDMIR